MSRILRVVALLPVLALLPGSVGAEPLHRAGKPKPVGSFAAAPLPSLWSWLVNLWEKNGCAIDPHGRCLPGAAPVQPDGADNGCGIDPWGHCQVAPAKNGCMIDPHGRCLPVAAPVQPASADNGCSIDPWGRCHG
jgi:hypothetical protein